ncbi:MAG: hypothetical protein N2738_04345 [Thermodesulfovibrionales bacterium]|nr:hypothetical protein [Thermodesulfovibrionales bacterium]
MKDILLLQRQALNLYRYIQRANITNHTKQALNKEIEAILTAITDILHKTIEDTNTPITKNDILTEVEFLKGAVSLLRYQHLEDAYIYDRLGDVINSTSNIKEIVSFNMKKGIDAYLQPFKSECF